jgi:hypothetical protein
MAKIANNQVSKPSAWIVNSTDKGRKSIKNGKVYLKDAEEFQIELFNPLQECVLADIKLNGSSISESGLVLRPGQRFYLDCFLDDKKKFIFNTYDVENTAESLNAISKNGGLEVYFYKESVVSINNWKNKMNTIVIEKHYPYYRPYWYNTPNIYCGTSTTTGGLSVTTGGYYTNGLDLNNTTSTNTAYYSNNVVNTNTGIIDLSNCIGSLTSTSMPINSSIETGRVEKGEKSKQKFDTIDMDFDNYYISSTILELLPESRKPVDAKKLKKKEKKSNNETIDLIKKMADLHSAGILTENEFLEKKKELLSKI